MFTTAPIQALQNLSNPFLDALLEFISFLGITPIIISICLIILFGISFKRGLVLINIVGWTALFTVFLKEQIDFPRPVDVDPTIESHYEPTGENLSDLKPTTFWEGFSDELLAKTRNDDFKRYGFPSGHSSIQTAFWLSMIFLFRKRWIKTLGVALILLTGLSRIYLGNHFLGDVLAGYLLGGFISFALIQLVKRSDYLAQRTHDFASLSLLWVPGILLFLAPFLPLWLAASLIGMNAAAILIILKRNFPVFHVIAWKRIATVLIGMLIYFVMHYFNYILQFTGIAYIDLLFVSLGYFAAIQGALSLCRRLGLVRFRY
ncbi:MAG: phosphatase PAP2 family protein [Vicingaceae bacterium]